MVIALTSFSHLLKFFSEISILFFDLELKKYFHSEFKTFNEREILTKSGKTLIPDKLVFLQRNKVGIIDYKTGKKNNAHKQQLNIYEEALKNMGIITHEKVLIYTDNKIEVEIFK